MPLGSEGVTSLSTPFETAQASISQNEMARGKFFDDLNAPRVGGPAPVVDKSFAQQAASKPSLMENPARYIKDTYTKGVEQLSQGFEDFKDDPIGTVFGENPIATTVDRASGQLTSALTDRLVQGKREAGNVYSTNVQGMSAAFDMPQVGTSPEVQQRTQELGYNPAAFKANYSWGAGAQNPEYMQSMGFDRFATVGGIG